MSILLGIAQAIVGVTLIVFCRQIGKSVQDRYIQDAEKLYGNSSRWESPRRRLLFTVMSAFVGVCFLLAAIPTAIGHPIDLAPSHETNQQNTNEATGTLLYNPQNTVTSY
jgi:hypothetical protein